VNIFSDCVIKATLDHPNSFMAAIIPIAISASLDTVLRKSGNILSLERRGDEDPGDIYIYKYGLVIIITNKQWNAKYFSSDAYIHYS